MKINCEKIYEELLEDDYKKEEVIELSCKMLRMLKHFDEGTYNRISLKMHVLKYGKHFCENMAKEAVECMKHFDGSYGEHWSVEQTTNLATQNNINTNKWDWYYLLNMLYSDAGNVFKNDIRTYVDFAKAVYLNDVDGDEGKIFDEYIAKNYIIY